MRTGQEHGLLRKPGGDTGDGATAQDQREDAGHLFSELERLRGTDVDDMVKLKREWDEQDKVGARFDL